MKSLQELCLLSITTRRVEKREKILLEYYCRNKLNELKMKWIDDRLYRSLGPTPGSGETQEILVAGERKVIIEYNRSGVLVSRSFYIGRRSYRDNDLPHRECFHPNGKIRSETWWHSAEKEELWPAEIEYDESGQKIRETWRTSDKRWLRHRKDGPAVVEYGKNGRVKEEGWYRYGQASRPYYQPSTVRYYDNGAIEVELFPKKLQAVCCCGKKCHCGHRKFQNRFYTLAENKRPDHEEYLKGTNFFPVGGKKPAQTKGGKKKKKNKKGKKKK